MSNDNRVNGEITDLELARLVRDLDPEIQPDRDLWRGIERQIMDAPQVQKRSMDWMPYGIAASLMIATAALVLNLLQPGNLQPVGLQAPVAYSPGQPGVTGMDVFAGEMTAVTNPMLERFDRVNSGLEEATRLDLMRNLDILKNARLELERDLRADPTNQRARQMLIRVHEKELALLRQDYLAPARSL